MKIDFNCNTDGSSLWSNRVTSVRCIGIETNYVNDEKNYSEVVVYFRPDTWNCAEDGLIYTDRGFLSDLKKNLKTLGIPTDFSYSEQGMQGSDYVSLDGDEKITRYLNKY